MSRASVVHSWRPADEDGVVASVCGLIWGRFKPAPEGSLPCKICSRILTGKSWLDTSAMPEEGPADARAAPPRPAADFAAWWAEYRAEHNRKAGAIVPACEFGESDAGAAYAAATARVRALVVAEMQRAVEAEGYGSLHALLAAIDGGAGREGAK